MEKYVYKHNVKYYETDQMGIVHHSNYIRWMEEARLDYFEECGWSYQQLEESGVLSPVISIDCKYKKSTRFNDNVFITVKFKEFKGVRLLLEYEMKNENNEIVALGKSEHCFTNKAGKVIRFNKESPKYYERLMELIEKDNN